MWTRRVEVELEQLEITRSSILDLENVGDGSVEPVCRTWLESLALCELIRGQESFDAMAQYAVVIGIIVSSLVALSSKSSAKELPTSRVYMYRL